ncbi:hypothetical protein [Streptomyces prunicolor]|uniref:hypothetical protein n=1 Tax=Streptomyces prunicolor TaxID=67348 RepID=UPI0034274FE1
MNKNTDMELFIHLLPRPASLVVAAGSPSGQDADLLAERELNVTRLDIATESTEILAFDDASVSGVWCDETLSRLDCMRISESLREFSRVLVAHGCLFISLEQTTSAGDEQAARDLIWAAGFNPLKIYVTDQHVCAFARNRADCCATGDKKFYDRNAF